MSVHSFESSGTNEELREFKKHNYEAHAKQRKAFKKLLNLGIEIQPQDPKIAKLIQSGIPSIYRQIFWPKLMENVHGITLNFYQMLLNKAAKLMSLKPQQVPEEKQKIFKHLNLIEQDIERTFPQLKIFKKENEQGQALFNVLSAWSVFREELGYLQGMSQISGFLLVELKQTEVFPIFCSIMTTDVVYAYYSMDIEEIQKFETAFEHKLKRSNDHVYYRLKALEIEVRSFLFTWIITLFTRIVDIETIGKLWDILFLHEIDQPILIQVCFWIIYQFQNIILDEELEAEQIAQYLKSAKLNELQAENLLSCLRGCTRA